MRRTTKVWIVVGIILIAAVSTFLFFSSAMEPYASAKNQANKIAYKSANISEPDYFSNFNHKKQYYTVGGRTDNNKYRYVVIDAKSGDIEILKNSHYSRNKILNQVKNKHNPKKIKHINLGMIDKKPVWEVSFVNKDKSIGYEMIDYQNGKVIQTINNI